LFEKKIFFFVLDLFIIVILIKASAAIIVNVLSALCELQTEELKILQTVLLLVNTTSVVVHSTLATVRKISEYIYINSFFFCF